MDRPSVFRPTTVTTVGPRTHVPAAPGVTSTTPTVHDFSAGDAPTSFSGPRTLVRPSPMWVFLSGVTPDVSSVRPRVQKSSETLLWTVSVKTP